MAKVFLDANAFVDFVEERGKFDLKQLSGHSLFLSPLSIHIISYLYKYRMPEKKLDEKMRETFTLIPLDLTITEHALNGPMPDFEDNVQLHSAAEAECDFFLTSDEKLLKMKFFGKAQMVSTLTPAFL